MSILIRDIRLPENCYECFCCNQTYQDKDDGNEFICTCNILTQDTTCFSSERREDCPLVEVPSSHGRLIDLDRLLYDMGLDKAKKYGNDTLADRNFSYGTLMRYEIADALEDAPVIIDKE